MKRNIFWIGMSSMVLFTILIAGTAIAQVPQEINYQGYLTDSGGNPLNQTVVMVFSLYDEETDGTSLWTETQNSVTVSDGIFNVLLGSVTAITLDFSQDYWLEIMVNSETLSPREPLVSVGYAFRSEYANNVDDADADSMNELNSGLTLNGTSLELTDVGGTLSQDLSSLQDGNGFWSQNGTDIVYFAGNVGIGTTSPEWPLDVLGDNVVPLKSTILKDGKDAYSNTGILLNKKTTGDMQDGFGIDVLFSGEDATATGKVFAAISGKRDGSDDDGALAFYTTQSGTYTEKLRIDNDGNVGIGIMIPTEKLDVNGNAKINGQLTLTNGSSSYTLPNTDGTDGQILKTDGSGTVSWENDINPTQVVWVAQSGADFISIQAALDSITDASASNPYLMMVSPGVYIEQVTMKAYVHIQGAGEDATIIRWTGSDTHPETDNTSATVIGANHAELRFLTVESEGTGKQYTTAIHNTNASPVLLHVTATASGGSSRSFGVFSASSSPTMIFVTATASGGTDSYGICNITSSSPTMHHVTVTAFGGSIGNVAVYSHYSSVTMMQVTATASGGGSSNYGVHNTSNSAMMTQVTVTASGGSHNYGIHATDSASMTIRNSSATGTTNSLYNDGGSSAKVANTLVDGTVVAGGGLTCIGVYNTSFVALDTSCQ